MANRKSDKPIDASLRPVVGYRVFVKKSEADQNYSWEGAPYSKFLALVPERTHYSIPLEKSLFGGSTSTGVVFRVLVAAMLDTNKIVLLDPDPAVKDRPDHQYPSGEQIAAWMTTQVIMPSNLKITSRLMSSNTSIALLKWDLSPAPLDSNYRITGYRVFYKKATDSSWSTKVPSVFTDTDENESEVQVLTFGRNYSYTVLPRGIRIDNEVEFVFGTNSDGFPLSGQQSNEVIQFGPPELLAQSPGQYGQAFVLNESIRSTSLSADFANMEDIRGGTAYRWQKATVNYPTSAYKDWSDIRDDNPEFEGQASSTLSFGSAGHPVATSDVVGWYRVVARNGAWKATRITSFPVRVYGGRTGTFPAPALISQSFTAGQTIYVAADSYDTVCLRVQFNNVSGPQYTWERSKNSILGPYSPGDDWSNIDGASTRTLVFGAKDRPALPEDSAWYRLKVSSNGWDAYSDAVYVKIGKGGLKSKKASYTEWDSFVQYPAPNEEILVPMDATTYGTNVAISAYPRMFWEYGRHTEYIFTWERSRDGQTSWSSIDSTLDDYSFPAKKDLKGRSSSLLRFAPNGDFADYAERVSGWYRLNVHVNDAAVLGSGVHTRLISRPVQVTVVEAGQGKPLLANQSPELVHGKAGSSGTVLIGAYFWNMDGVGNGYHWQYNGSTGNPTPSTVWVDRLPVDSTIAGLGTPTLAFGISSAVGARVESTGWYRLTATNQFGSTTSKPIRVVIDS